MSKKDKPVHRENPKQFLSRLVHKKVKVVLKWGLTYEGILLSSDNYFNILLDDCYESDDNNKSNIGQVSIRCNNVKMIVEA